MSDVALFLHIVGVLVFTGGLMLAAAAFESARRRTETAEVSALLALARAGVLAVIVGSVLIAAFGLWLVSLNHFGYGTGWVQASIALYIAALALGAFGGRAPKKARVLAGELHDGGSAAVSEPLRRLLDDRRTRAANYGSLAMISAIVALMVFKP